MCQGDTEQSCIVTYTKPSTKGERINWVIPNGAYSEPTETKLS